MYRQEKNFDVKRKRHPAYLGMSAEDTFLEQFQLELVVRIRQLPVLAHQVVVHVGTSVVHALKKY
jgi:hypothetical protein